MGGAPQQQEPADEEVLGHSGAKSQSGGESYQIRVRGHLNSRWSGWFEGLAISHQEDGTTLLTGNITDQPALHGIIIRIRDLGLPLLSIVPMGKDGGSWTG